MQQFLSIVVYASIQLLAQSITQYYSKFNIVDVVSPLPGCEGKEADVLFLIDASRSIWAPDFTKLLRFVRGVMRHFDVSDYAKRVGVLAFSDITSVEYRLEQRQDRASVARAIVNVAQTLGTTRTDDALATAGHLLARSNRPSALKVVIVLTDGQSDYSDMTRTEAATLHLAGVRVLAIGIGNDIDLDELKYVAQMDSRVFTVPSINKLKHLREELAVKVCGLGMGNDNEAYTPPTKGCGGKPAEIVFALDSSGSIWAPDFKRQLNFVKDLVGAFQVSPQKTRIGVLTFGDVPKKQFYLDRYNNDEQVTWAVGDIQQTRGGTNTGTAIDMMTNEFFSPGHSRDKVVKIGIVITDGRSESREETAAKAEEARRAGISLFAIGVGQDVDETELAAIGSEPREEYVFTVNNYDALNTIKELLSMKACEVTLPPTTTTTTTPKPPTTHKLMIMDEGCSDVRPADVIFSLPLETSTAHTGRLYRFISNVSSELKVEKDIVRVGVVPRECYPLPGFALDSAATKKEALKLFNTEPFRPTKTAQVIKYMRRKGFQKSNGGRAEAKKIGILIIDSSSPSRLAGAAKQARLARRRDIELFVVAIGKDVSPQLKQAISGQLDDRHVFSVSDYSQLPYVASKVARNVNSKCLE